MTRANLKCYNYFEQLLGVRSNTQSLPGYVNVEADCLCLSRNGTHVLTVYTVDSRQQFKNIKECQIVHFGGSSISPRVN